MELKTNQKENNKVQRMLEGEVVSDKMDKTIVVQVQRTFKHPVIGKIVKSFKKYKVHDENKAAHVGDIVEIVECRPISKTKHMRMLRIVKQGSSKEVLS